MLIEASERDGVSVVTLTGDFDADASVHVREVACTLLVAGRALILDLSGVERLYSAGISVLLELQRSARRQGIRLVCCGARPFVRELLRITMLDRSLNLLGDLESAILWTREAS